MEEFKIDLEKRPKSWYKKWWGILIILVLIIIIATALAFGWQTYSIYQKIKKGELSNEELTFLNINLNVNASQTIDIDDLVDDDPYTGAEDAKLVIVVFEDFECYYCGESFLTIKQVINTYGDQIKFVYRDYPNAEAHPNAMNAAMAGECAHEQDKFWEMHDKIFLNQNNLTIDYLKLYALQIGLDTDQFNECLDSGKYEQEIQNDIIDGVAYGASGTPVFFFNGQKVEGVIPLDIFQEIIDFYLE